MLHLLSIFIERGLLLGNKFACILKMTIGDTLHCTISKSTFVIRTKHPIWRMTPLMGLRRPLLVRVANKKASYSIIRSYKIDKRKSWCKEKIGKRTNGSKSYLLACLVFDLSGFKVVRLFPYMEASVLRLFSSIEAVSTLVLLSAISYHSCHFDSFLVTGTMQCSTKWIEPVNEKSELGGHRKFGNWWQVTPVSIFTSINVCAYIDNYYKSFLIVWVLSLIQVGRLHIETEAGRYCVSKYIGACVSACILPVALCLLISSEAFVLFEVPSFCILYLVFVCFTILG